MVVMFGMY